MGCQSQVSVELVTWVKGVLWEKASLFPSLFRFPLDTVASSLARRGTASPPKAAIYAGHRGLDEVSSQKSLQGCFGGLGEMASIGYSVSTILLASESEVSVGVEVVAHSRRVRGGLERGSLGTSPMAASGVPYEEQGSARGTRFHPFLALKGRFQGLNHVLPASYAGRRVGTDYRIPSQAIFL
jgi:hypothetical protein